MKILGIETSCDDTGAALLEGGRNTAQILSNVVASQIEIHQKYGGVYPTLAKREHQKNLPLVFTQALGESKPDAIAITYGPGLSPCLWQGITFAQEKAQELNIPLIPVNHMEGHLLAALLFSGKDQEFETDISHELLPALGLLVSGGHTELILVEKLGAYKIIGETRDDAAGEAFDKTARILGLPYPGGPEIAAKAKESKQNTFDIRLPRPMLHTKDFDFSFSGLKTAVLYDYNSRTPEERESASYIQEMAKEIQEAILDVLMKKTFAAADEYAIKTLTIGGGVSANDELRARFLKEAENRGIILRVPPKHLSTDNGAMIALAGYIKWLRGEYLSSDARIEAEPNLRLE
ncbi:MAG: tRNA (adenosine(37)-N6)-threonylcarbamoyltransferase complex transferase subunit TsaD [Candidatus Yanofskybacteria bacterium]|nr:tRNA (adenosine(37)-N6)-threonylcarbamoyltransferase complex transferase subunit TsaD [Candidatus Yanofskybacteria bacterium]